MKDGSHFKYERSTRQHARKMLVIALGFPLCIVGMMAYLGGSHYGQKELMMVAGIASVVSVFLIAFIVIPNYRRNAVFRFEVSDSRVHCEYPGSESYDIPLDDITGLKQVKNMAGRTTAEDFIETTDGVRHKIPLNYDLNIHKVKKAIMAARPDIERSSDVRY